MSTSITKFAKIFNSNETLDLLDKLQNDHVIAGGSIVWFLNDFVPKSSIGDIDVFINSKEKFIETAEYILNKYNGRLFRQTYCEYGEYSKETLIDNELTTSSEICGDQIVCRSDNHINYVYMVGNKVAKTTWSVYNIKIKDEPVDIQLIYLEYDNPNDIIMSFDFDYVQCALHKNNLYITEDCKDSHRTRSVQYSFGSVDYARLAKAIDKGFKAPFMGRKNPQKKYSVVPICVRFNLVPLHIDRDRKRTLITIPKISNMSITKKICEINYSMCTYVTGEVTFDAILFNRKFTCRGFALDIVVMNKKNVNFYVIRSVRLGPITIERCKIICHFPNDLIGKNIRVEASLYFTAHGTPTLFVSRLANETHILCNFPDDFNIDFINTVPDVQIETCYA